MDLTRSPHASRHVAGGLPFLDLTIHDLGTNIHARSAQAHAVCRTRLLTVQRVKRRMAQSRYRAMMLEVLW